MAAPIAIDVWGSAWTIREARPTPMGWPVLLGRPAGERGPAGAAVIVTPEMDAWMQEHRHTPADCAALPLGKNAIKRLRRLLGHHWREDRAGWWIARLPDLADLTGAEFALRHGVSQGAASTWRRSMLGARQRPTGWWQAPETAHAILAQPTAIVAAALGIPASSVRRLRAHLDLVERKAPGAE